MDKLSVRDLDASGKRVFVRVDFNVPIEDGRVTDDSRIRAALPTIGLLLQKGAAVIVASHLGRPNGRVVDAYRLRPVAERLSQLLGRYVPITGDALGPGTLDAVQRLKPGQVLMLENLRFHAEEEANDPKFAKTLASYADAYVNDAFGTAHRAHASTVGITQYLPAYAGLLMEREIEMLSRLLESPERPFAAVLGGAKVSGKINVLDSLMQRVDMFVVGGGMANTFLVAQGFTVGKSLLEKDRLEDARRVLAAADKKGISVVLPTDVVVAKEVTRGAERKIVSARKIPNSWSAVDIGPASVRAFEEALARTRTVFWNGPLGVFEVPTFGDGTRAMARFLAERAEAGVTVVIGGGDSVAAVEQLGLGAKMTHMSTGGGASLEFLEKGDLPGIAALLDRDQKESAEARLAADEPTPQVQVPPLYPDLPPPVRPALRPLVPAAASATYQTSSTSSFLTPMAQAPVRPALPARAILPGPTATPRPTSQNGRGAPVRPAGTGTVPRKLAATAISKTPSKTSTTPTASTSPTRPTRPTRRPAPTARPARTPAPARKPAARRRPAATATARRALAGRKGSGAGERRASRAPKPAAQRGGALRRTSAAARASRSKPPHPSPARKTKTAPRTTAAAQARHSSARRSSASVAAGRTRSAQASAKARPTGKSVAGKSVARKSAASGKSTGARRSTPPAKSRPAGKSASAARSTSAQRSGSTGKSAGAGGPAGGRKANQAGSAKRANIRAGAKSAPSGASRGSTKGAGARSSGASSRGGSSSRGRSSSRGDKGTSPGSRSARGGSPR